MFSPGLRKDRGCRNHNGRQKSRGNMPNVGVGWYSEFVLLWADAEIQISVSRWKWQSMVLSSPPGWNAANFQFKKSEKKVQASLEAGRDDVACTAHMYWLFGIVDPIFFPQWELWLSSTVTLSIRDAHSSCTTQRCTTTDAKTVQKFATWVRVDSWMFLM